MILTHSRSRGDVRRDANGSRRNYQSRRSSSGMDRQKLFALFFAFLMVSSMVAWGVTAL